MTRPAWHTPVDAVTRAWVEASAGSGWRVTRAGRMRGGIAMATDGIALLGPNGDVRRLVLRRWLRPGWRHEDPEFTAAREAEVLRRLAGSGIPVPAVVAVDQDGARVGAPAILMTHLEGRRPSVAQERRPRLIGDMAAALVRIHGVDQGLRRVVGAFEPYDALGAVRAPAGSRRPDLWRRAVELAGAGTPSVGRAVFLHRDYHPGNTLWAGGRLAGIVDWTNASWGAPAMDLAHWRANLGTRHGIEVADLAVAAYRALGGEADDQAWWDLRIALDFINDPGSLSAGEIERTEAYLEAVVRR